MRSFIFRALALLAITALTACSGGGTASNPLPQQAPVAATTAPDGGAGSASTTRASFVVLWPSAAQGAATAKRRDAISASTQSISVTVNGGPPTVVNKPTLTGSPSTTKVSIPAPPGNDAFTFIAWDQTGGTGNELDQVTSSQVIIANANNTVTAALNGVCAALVPSLYGSSAYVQTHSVTTPLTSGTRTILKTARLVGNFVQSFTFTPVDADGNTILTDAGTVPISVTESGTVPHVTIAASAAGTANTTFRLTPLAAEPDGFSTQLTASSPNCGTGTATLPNSFALSTSAEVLVLDYYNGLYAYDQDGTQLATISTAKNMTGLAYNSKSNSLVMTVYSGGSSSGLVAFQTLSLTGSSLGSGYFTPSGYATNDSVYPGQIAFDPVTGFFAVPISSGEDGSGNPLDGVVQNVAISASTATLETSVTSGNYPLDPTAVTVEPNGTVFANDASVDSNGNRDGTNVAITPGVLDEFLGGPPAAAVTTDTQRGYVLSAGFDGTGGIFFISPAGAGFDRAFEYPATGDYTIDGLAYNQGEDELYGLIPGYEGFGTATLYEAVIGLPGSAVYSGGSSTSNLPSGAFPSLIAPVEAAVIP